MNFLIIHNEYSKRGGEESVVEFQKSVLERAGHRVKLYTRSYGEMNSWLLGRAGGMFTSVFNPRSLRDLKRILKKDKFDAAILHNLFPIISPAIIPLLKAKGVKVLHVVHNYRLFCPIGLLYRKGGTCRECLAKGREWNCAKNRCVGGLFASLSFAVKFRAVRLLNYYRGIDRFLCLNSLQADLVSHYMKAENRVVLLPNAVEVSKKKNREASKRRFVSFVGRLTEEKGFFDVLQIASQMPDYEFVIGGGKMQDVKTYVPNNVSFRGFLKGENLRELYASSRVVLFLSKCYEGFGLVVVEAMNEGTPVITFDATTAKDIVERNKCGYVVAESDFGAVKERIRMLFEDEAEFTRLSENAKAAVRQEYSVERYRERLIEAIENIE